MGVLDDVRAIAKRGQAKVAREAASKEKGEREARQKKAADARSSAEAYLHEAIEEIKKQAAEGEKSASITYGSRVPEFRTALLGLLRERGFKAEVVEIDNSDPDWGKWIEYEIRVSWGEGK